MRITPFLELARFKTGFYTFFPSVVYQKKNFYSKKKPQPGHFPTSEFFIGTFPLLIND